MLIREYREMVSLEAYPLFDSFFQTVIRDKKPYGFCSYALQIGDACYALNLEDLEECVRHCLVFESTKAIHGLDVLLTVYHAWEWGAVDKVRTLGLAYDVLGDRESLQEVAACLKLPEHSQALSLYLKIWKLPSDLLDQCLQKQFSMKQLGHLCRFKPTFLNWFSENILPRFSFSASVLLDVLESLHDVWRRFDLDFQRMGAVLGFPVLSTDLSLFRKRLLELRYPIQERQNKHIHETLNTVSVHQNAQFSWDRSLENKGIDMTLRFLDDVDLDQLDEVIALKPQLKKVLTAMDLDDYGN